MEIERDNNTRGIAGAGLGLGVAGTALGVLNSGGLGGILGGGWGNNCGGAMFAWERELSHKDAEIGSLKADLATDRKILELYQYVDGRMRGIEGQLAQQAVINAQLGANISCMQGKIDNLEGLTRTYIPISNIVPRPMARYNNWVAPNTTGDETAPATTG